MCFGKQAYIAKPFSVVKQALLMVLQRLQHNWSAISRIISMTCVKALFIESRLLQSML